MQKSLLKQIILDQKQTFKLTQRPVKRDNITLIKSHFDNEQIIILSGVRRCGKSTLLHYIREQQSEKDFFINFDDERLASFHLEDFQTLLEAFIELFGEQRHFYFDEIQNIVGWERFIRRLHDNQYSILITGSNASMLSAELGTHLTGRHHQIELFPFSFSEYLSFNKHEPEEVETTIAKSKQQKVLYEYLTHGGFPGYLKNLQHDYLVDLYQNILYRDIVTRHRITMVNQLKEMIYFIASNIGKLIKFGKIRQMLQIGNVTTIKNYFEYLQDAYLVFIVSKFDFSVKRQLLAPKKIYFIDSAMAQKVGFRFSEDLGRILENVVYLQLRRQQKEIFYYAEKKECDFIIRHNGKISEAYQVSQTLAEPATKKRKIDGLIEAMENFNLDAGLILTLDEEDNFSVNYNAKEYQINVMPLWKWLSKLSTLTDL